MHNSGDNVIVRITSRARRHLLTRSRTQQALYAAHALSEGTPMSSKRRYVIAGPDVDLETEVVLDSDGRRIDDAHVDEVVAAAHEYLDRRAGRPSLTGRAERSPQVTFRVTPEMKARAEVAARVQGTKVSHLARRAFEQVLVS
jgi:predicted HicB family RNase H-like nuclease